jgi:hypothetical protein
MPCNSTRVVSRDLGRPSGRYETERAVRLAGSVGPKACAREGTLFAGHVQTNRAEPEAGEFLDFTRPSTYEPGLAEDTVTKVGE